MVDRRILPVAVLAGALTVVPGCGPDNQSRTPSSASPDVSPRTPSRPKLPGIHDIYLTSSCVPGQRGSSFVHFSYDTNDGRKFELHDGRRTVTVDPQNRDLEVDGDSFHSRRFPSKSVYRPAYVIFAGRNNLRIKIICGQPRKPTVV